MNGSKRNFSAPRGSMGMHPIHGIYDTPIYTTNAIESLNATVRRAVRARGHFTSTGAAKKLMYLALREASAKWTAPMAHWQSFKREFAIHFEDRFNPSKGWVSEVKK